MSDDQGQADLSAVGVETPEPLLKREWPIVIEYEPDDGEKDTRLAGFICWMRHRRMRCYSSWRRAFHYYREGEGYAISAEVLARARQHDASRVVIHEAEDHGDDAFEYGMDQWLNADFVEEGHLADSDDPQRYLPEDEAMHTWPGHAPELFVREFEDACSRIRQQRGWPDG